jgi:hypothetical protein
MTNIEQFKPRYPMLYVYPSLVDGVPSWIVELFLDDGCGCIMDISTAKPLLSGLRDECDPDDPVTIIIDED